MPGRTPKTARKLKLEKGKLYGDQAKKKDIKKTPEKPIPPEYFNQNQLDIWNRIVDLLRAYGLLHLANEAIMELLAYDLNEMRTVIELLENEELVIFNEQGTAKTNPLFTIKKSLHDMIIKCCAQLGLSSTALVRIGNIGGKEETDAFEGLLD